MVGEDHKAKWMKYHTIKLPPVYTVALNKMHSSSHISWDEKQKPGPHTNRVHKFISTHEVISECT